MGADGAFGTSAIISNRGGDTNILIENNLLAGGAYTLYCEQNANGVNYRVTQQPLQPQVQPEGRVLRPVDRLLRRDPVRQRLPRDGKAIEIGLSARDARLDARISSPEVPWRDVLGVDAWNTAHIMGRMTRPGGEIWSTANLPWNTGKGLDDPRACERARQDVSE